jgi:hypothetical protein
MMKHNKKLLNAINAELDHYDGMAKELIRIEGLSRIRRYGRQYYQNHIHESDGLFSDYTRTFVYLKFMEDTLKDLKRNGL